MFLNARRYEDPELESPLLVLAFADITDRTGQGVLAHQPQAQNQALTKANTALQQETRNRQQAETAHREIEENFRLFLETVKDYAIFMLDPGGHVISWNPGAIRIKGYQSEEILGQHFSCFYPPEEIQQGKPAHILQVAAAKGQYVEEAGRRRRKDGTLFWANVTLIALRDATGLLRGYAKVTQDITERKQLEAELRRQERLATIGTTVAKLAHEIGNPLNGMHTTLQILERHLAQQPTLADEVVREGLHDLAHETARLGSLLQELRAFVQSRPPLALQPTDLAEIVATVLKAQAATYAERNITVVTTVAPDLPPVLADPLKLEQVVWNLCLNAGEAMPAGGTLTVQATHAADAVCLDVHDTGQGIVPDVDIFTPFVTTKPDGTGLGLAVVKQIVESHHGTITYASPPGHGTTFTVRLPVAAKETEECLPAA
jgi:PAS domain S-box-containing protein